MKRLLLIWLLCCLAFPVFATSGNISLPDWAAWAFGIFIPSTFGFAALVRSRLNEIYEDTLETKKLAGEIHVQLLSSNTERLHKENQKLLERMVAIQEQTARTLNELVVWSKAKEHFEQ